VSRIAIEKMSKLFNTALNLKQFMLRRSVLNLYRDLLRAISKVPDESSRSALIKWLRDDFAANRTQTDELQIKMSMQVGIRSLRELQNSLDLSASVKRDEK
jgi:plasmid replication initiation protein